jgi:hypothetical protein
MIDVNLGPALWLSHAVVPHVQRRTAVGEADMARESL